MPAWVSHPAHSAIIDALIRARKGAGLTQREVAARLRKPPSFVGKVEAIERNLSVLEFIAWTRAIGVDPAKVLASARKSFDPDSEI
jgi:transcriptional regulator with XRE-family HTH domain